MNDRSPRDAAQVAHELVNLLGVVLTNVGLVTRTYPQHPAQEELAEIRDAATRAVEVVRQTATARPQ
jgi:hypothetical protein